MRVQLPTMEGNMNPMTAGIETNKLHYISMISYLACCCFQTESGTGACAATGSVVLLMRSCIVVCL